jgi:hypothetical protein
MSTLRSCGVFAGLVVLLAIALNPPLQAQKTTALDSTLYTTYSVPSDDTSVSWIVCGSTAQTSGCYAAGSLSPFVKAGAMIEGNPTTSGNTVTRFIYIVDSGASTVVLYVYKKTDTITVSSDTVSVTLVRKVNLPLTGSSTAQTFMAANNSYLYIGTDQSTQAARVKKSNLSVVTAGAFSYNVSAITADQYGYVTITQGSSFPSGFAVYDPSGNMVEDGGGASFMLDTVQGILTSNLPTGDQPGRQLGYRPKSE